MGHIDQSLLAEPPKFSKIPRSADGSVDGQQCLVWGLETLDIGGGIRNTLVGLQSVVREPARAQ